MALVVVRCDWYHDAGAFSVGDRLKFVPPYRMVTSKSATSAEHGVIGWKNSINSEMPRIADQRFGWEGTCASCNEHGVMVDSLPWYWPSCCFVRI